MKDREKEVTALITTAKCWGLEWDQKHANKVLEQIELAIQEYKLNHPQEWAHAEEKAARTM